MAQDAPIGVDFLSISAALFSLLFALNFLQSLTFSVRQFQPLATKLFAKGRENRRGAEAENPSSARRKNKFGTKIFFMRMKKKQVADLFCPFAERMKSAFGAKRKEERIVAERSSHGVTAKIQHFAAKCKSNVKKCCTKNLFVGYKKRHHPLPRSCRKEEEASGRRGEGFGSGLNSLIPLCAHKNTRHATEKSMRKKGK